MDEQLISPITCVENKDVGIPNISYYILVKLLVE